MATKHNWGRAKDHQSESPHSPSELIASVPVFGTTHVTYLIAALVAVPRVALVEAAAAKASEKFTNPNVTWNATKTAVLAIRTGCA